MSYQIIPRTQIGLPAIVTSSGGTPRPRLQNEQYMTCHYTGVDVIFSTRDTPTAIRSIDNSARNRPVPAPFEYNYVIDQKVNDVIYEYAGMFQAAHSAGENDSAVGVLLLNGTRESPTNLQINKWRWLRDRFLIPNGILRAVPDQRPHRQMPAAATACPGQLILNRWNEFLTPYQSSPVPPTPTPIPPQSGTLLLYKVVSGDSYWKICEKLYEDSKATNERVAALQAANGNKALQPGDIINVPGRLAA